MSLTTITSTDDVYQYSAPSAPNDSDTDMMQLAAGTDATLGALLLQLILHPSATGASRKVIIQSADNSDYREILINPNGGKVSINAPTLTNLLNTAGAAVSVDAAQTLTNKTISFAANTISGLPVQYRTDPAAGNDADSNEFELSAGTDGTLGPLDFQVVIHPSATGGSRVVKILAGDAAAWRNISIAPNATTLINILAAVSGTLSSPTASAGSIATVDASQTLTNKTIDPTLNSIPGIALTGGSGFYTATLAKLTPTGSEGSITFNNFGVMISATNPT